MNRKSFVIAALTIFVQYYNYHLFGFLAAKIASNFVPSKIVVIQLLNTYFIMFITMAAKPLGAVILGRIGDIYGRSNSFNVSLTGCAIAAVIISLIPSYEQIGIYSSFILLLARMAICTLVSSGSDGVRIYIYEHIGKEKECLSMGLSVVFTHSGSLVASMSAWFFTLDFMPNYSWRIAFLLGSIMCLILIYYKMKFQIKDQVDIKKSLNFESFKDLSIKKIVQKNIRLFLYCTILAGAIGSTNQFFIIFFSTYNFEILKNISRSHMQFYNIIAIFLYILFGIIAGYVGDRFNRYKVVNIAIIFILILSLCHIYVLSSSAINVPLFFLSSASLPFVTIPATAILAGSIPVALRYRILSLSHAVGSILISAPTAFLSALLYYKTKIAYLPIMYFIITIIMLSLSLKFLKKTSDENKIPVG